LLNAHIHSVLGRDLQDLQPVADFVANLMIALPDRTDLLHAHDDPRRWQAPAYHMIDRALADASPLRRDV
jgi:hypothetical protein